jgi:hypothetical protein
MQSTYAYMRVKYMRVYASIYFVEVVYVSISYRSIYTDMQSTEKYILVYTLFKKYMSVYHSI